MAGTNKHSPAKLAKLGISLAFAIWLLQRLVAQGKFSLGDEWDHAHKGLLLVACLMYGTGGVLLASLRLGLLLRVQQVQLPYFDLMRLTMIGNFWNLAIPGGVGGDAVKLWEVRKQAGPRTTEAMLTVLIDRIIGLLGLFLVAIVSVVFCWDFLSHRAPPTVVRTVFIVASVSLAGFAGVGMGLLHRQLRRLPGVEPIVQAFQRKLPGPSYTIGRVVGAVDLYRDRGLSVAVCLLMSMVIHSSVGVGLMLIGWSVHASPQVHWQDYFLATQMANTVAAVPVTPGGLGARDSVINVFLDAVGGEASKSTVIPLFLTLIIVFWGLVGGLFVAVEPSQERKEIEEMLEHEYLDSKVEELPEPGSARGESELELESPAHA